MDIPTAHSNANVEIYTRTQMYAFHRANCYACLTVCLRGNAWNEFLPFHLHFSSHWSRAQIGNFFAICDANTTPWQRILHTHAYIVVNTHICHLRRPYSCVRRREWVNKHASVNRIHLRYNTFHIRAVILLDSFNFALFGLHKFNLYSLNVTHTPGRSKWNSFVFACQLKNTHTMAFRVNNNHTWSLIGGFGFFPCNFGEKNKNISRHLFDSVHRFVHALSLFLIICKLCTFLLCFESLFFF